MRKTYTELFISKQSALFYAVNDTDRMVDCHATLAMATLRMGDPEC
jgi:hypothetical protein